MLETGDIKLVSLLYEQLNSNMSVEHVRMLLGSKLNYASENLFKEILSRSCSLHTIDNKWTLENEM